MSTARTNIDFERSGRQLGFIDIAHSPHEDAWGATRIPIAVISNGKGPTAILQGGNHGHEYEGPITLGELIRELDPGLVSGRLIILPAINTPATTKIVIPCTSSTPPSASIAVVAVIRAIL